MKRLHRQTIGINKNILYKIQEYNSVASRPFKANKIREKQSNFIRTIMNQICKEQKKIKNSSRTMSYLKLYDDFGFSNLFMT